MTCFKNITRKQKETKENAMILSLFRACRSSNRRTEEEQDFCGSCSLLVLAAGQVVPDDGGLSKA